MLTLLLPFGDSSRGYLWRDKINSHYLDTTLCPLCPNIMSAESLCFAVVNLAAKMQTNCLG
eukprot:155868-Amphidinium_carterae.1